MDAAPASVSLPPRSAAPDAALNDPGHFINRELSSLAFNERLLDEACDPAVPLLERLRFLAILSGNLDEFFMIRVAGLKQQLAGRVEETGPDAMSPAEQLQHISQRCHAMVERQEGARAISCAATCTSAPATTTRPPRAATRILATMQGDNQKAWALRRDGSYQRVQQGAATPLRSQEQFIALSRRATLVDASRPAVQSLLAPPSGPRRRRRR